MSLITIYFPFQNQALLLPPRRPRRIALLCPPEATGHDNQTRDQFRRVYKNESDYALSNYVMDRWSKPATVQQQKKTLREIMNSTGKRGVTPNRNQNVDGVTPTNAGGGGRGVTPTKPGTASGVTPTKPFGAVAGPTNRFQPVGAFAPGRGAGGNLSFRSALP